MTKLKSSRIIDLINWLNSLRSVTDFETSALASIKGECDASGIKARWTDGGLLIGNPELKIVFLAHVDRIGFIGISGKLEVGSRIKLSYVARPKSVTPRIIKERFSNGLLIGFDPSTGEDLFIAYLIQDDSDDFQANVCHIIDKHHPIISHDTPIPLTAVKPVLSQVGDLLQGFFDNSAGLAIAIAAVAKHPEQLSCMITVAEEGGGYQNWPTGGRGAQKYIHNHDPRKILVVIDVRFAGLIQSTEQENCVGMGVVLREAEYRKNDDGNPRLLLRVDEEVLAFIKKYCERENIRYQTFSGFGITEAGRGYETLGQNARLRCVWLQPPIANEHSQFEVVSLSDLEGTLRIAEELREFVPIVTDTPADN